MRVLVTGTQGQLARALAERFETSPLPDVNLQFSTRAEVDLERPDGIEAAISAVAPDVVINAAAYTAVDKAEDEPDLARRVNAEAPGRLADAMASRGGRMIQVSTDYVFGDSAPSGLLAGDEYGRFLEEDPPAAGCVYGQTKLDGEIAVRDALEAHAIVRTAWVYSPFGHNFVKTMLRLAGERDELTVVDDQYGSPTSALDLADGLLAVLSTWQRAPDTGLGGVYHCVGAGQTTWAGLARAVMDESAAHGGPTADVTGIPTRAWPTKARRPANSTLDCSRFVDTFGYTAPDWRQSVGSVVQRLLTEGKN